MCALKKIKVFRPPGRESGQACPGRAGLLLHLHLGDGLAHPLPRPAHAWPAPGAHRLALLLLHHQQALLGEFLEYG